MSVNGRGAGTAVTQNLLDQAQLHTGLQQMRGIGMAQGMHRGGFFNATLSQCSLERIAQVVSIDRTLLARRARLQTGRKKPGSGAVQLPEGAQRLQSRLRQRHLSVLVAFTTHAQDFTLTIHITDLHGSPFTNAQAASVNRVQTDAINRSTYAT